MITWTDDARELPKSADDPYVIKIISGIDRMMDNPEHYPELIEQIGRFVVRYEPELAPKGEQWIWTSDDVNEAKTWTDPGDLHRYYLQAIGTRAWDARPDRPITVFHIEVARRSHYQVA